MCKLTRGEKAKEQSGLRSQLQFNFAPFLHTLAQASQSVLMLDYDGTLAPFRVNRDQAHPYPGVAPLIREIMNTTRTEVIIVTGRDANEVRQLLNIYPHPEIWGVHGLQRLRVGGTIDMVRLDERTLDGLSDADGWLGYLQLRYVAEFKAGSIAIHWRGLQEIEEEDLRARVLLGWRPIAEHSGLDLLQFDGGVEIRAREANKGDAVRTFLSEVSPDAPAAYLGDDATDESAFLAINGRGLSVLVRPESRQTAAQFWLKPPEELLEFLSCWLKACVERDTSSSNSGAAAAVNR
jgi:trehalose 6-phosphate phosphatase